jgi:hypothetical protein
MKNRRSLRQEVEPSGRGQGLKWEDQADQRQGDE